MKRNAIARIIIYSLLTLVLTVILIVGMAPKFWMGQFASGDNVPKEGWAPETIRRLEIDWAAGNITIRKNAHNNCISFNEMGPDGCWYHMDYECDEYTLQISYGAKFTVGKSVEKDLIIEVPANWTCDELELNAAGVIVNIEDVDVHTLELGGAGCRLNYYGHITNLDVDGAGAEMIVNCTGRPKQVDLDGMGCKLELNLPNACGFSVITNGLGCTLNTSLPLVVEDGRKVYGDKACKISVNGLGCEIAIMDNSNNDTCAHVWSQNLMPTGPDSNVLIYTCTICGITQSKP